MFSVAQSRIHWTTNECLDYYGELVYFTPIEQKNSKEYYKSLTFFKGGFNIECRFIPGIDSCYEVTYIKGNVLGGGKISEAEANYLSKINNGGKDLVFKETSFGFGPDVAIGNNIKCYNFSMVVEFLVIKSIPLGERVKAAKDKLDLSKIQGL